MKQTHDDLQSLDELGKLEPMNQLVTACLSLFFFSPPQSLVFPY
jgi:hypothetical protein